MSEYDHETILGAGAALGTVKIVRPDDSGPSEQFLIIPDGYRAEKVDIEKLLNTPMRNKGSVSVATVDSFLLFVERELIYGTTVCFANLDKSTFTVIFNYSGGGNLAGWSDRCVSVCLKKTTSFPRWILKDRAQMDQLTFADFIEENMADISEPDAATVIEMIQQLKVHRKAEFISVVDPRTGFTNLTFNEQTSGETLKGNIEFCGRFVLGIAPFRGSDKYRIDAALRFNINEANKLRVFYSLINADLVEEHAFDAQREKVLVKMQELGVPVFDI